MTDHTLLYCSVCTEYKNIREFSQANHYKLKDLRKCKVCTRLTFNRQRRNQLHYRHGTGVTE